MPAKEVKTNVLFIFSYQSCIRQEAGYCCIEYSVSNNLFYQKNPLFLIIIAILNNLVALKIVSGLLRIAHM